jgi:adenylate kinase family enzyme
MQTTSETDPATPARVIFYGVTGSGKSSAARAYAKATGLPEFSADDDVGWLPGWQQRSTQEQRELARGIAAQDRWVLDSAYGVWRDLVVARADLIVGLDYARWLSLGRLIRRSVRRVVSRQPVCNGNIETLARLVGKDSIIVWHFRSFKRKRRVMRAFHADPPAPSVMVFRRPSELDAWLEQVVAAGRRAESI